MELDTIIVNARIVSLASLQVSLLKAMSRLLLQKYTSISRV